MSNTLAPPAKKTDATPPRRVSQRHDATERQADRAADIVARGGSVTGWSFSSVPAEASVHREEDDKKKLEDKPRTQGEAYEEAAGKGLERATEIELPSGKKVREVIEDSPPLSAAAAAGLALAGKDVPLPLSSIPGVKSVAPSGLSVGVRAEGLPGLIGGDPHPGGVRFGDVGLGLSIGYTEQLPTGAKKPLTAAQKKAAAIAADTERLRNDPIMKRIEAQRDKEAGDAAIAALVARQRFAPPGQLPGLPMLPLDAPVTQSKPDDAVKAEEQKKREEPVQRAPATTADAAPAAGYDTAGLAAATRGGGRPLEPALRHSMEARFGYDFSSVRLHDDPQAASAASGVDAAAFTVGEHIVFGSGRFDPSTPQGRHLIAHELAHVVQERGGAAPRATSAPTRIHRLDVGNWFALLFGGEGTWTDQELKAYLQKVTATGAHEGWWESDNKARAIVRKYVAAAPGWDLLPAQKRLLIDEMQDGAVLDEDENAILDLLTTASWEDLTAIFSDPAKRWTSLDSDLDGEEHTRLVDFADSTFIGGAASLRRGELRLASPAVPASAPAFPYDAADFEERVRSETITSQELVARIERFPPAGKKQAIDYVRDVAWVEATETYALCARLLAAASKDEKPGRQRLLNTADRQVGMLKVVVTHFLRAELPASARDLSVQTKAITRAQAVDAKAALEPEAQTPVDPDDIEILGPDGQPIPDQKSADGKKDGEAGKKAGGTSTPGPADDRKDTARSRREAKQKEEKEKAARLAPTGSYGIAIKATLQELIDDKFANNVTGAGTHVPHEQIVPIAAVAERETDAVLGAYYRTRSDVKPGEKVTRAIERLDVTTKDKPGNVHSWYEEYDAQLKGLKRQDDARRNRSITSRLGVAAFHWALYYLRSDEEILGINTAEGASPKLREGAGDTPTGENTEAKTQLTIVRELLKDGIGLGGFDAPTTNADKLLATKRAWGGMAGRDDIYVDMSDTGDPATDRMQRWRMLQTLIHEYLHVLAHDDYDAYAQTFASDSVPYTTLIEGVDEVFAAMVWSAVSTRTADLRAEVEGARFATLPATFVPPAGHYPHIAQAMKLISTVGLPNVTAAYFLGLVDRIGGPSKPGPVRLPQKNPPKKPAAAPLPGGTP